MSIKIKQIEVDSNFNINNFRIVNLSDPTDNTDAVNFQTLKTMISGITTG